MSSLPLTRDPLILRRYILSDDTTENKIFQSIAAKLASGSRKSEEWIWREVMEPSQGTREYWVLQVDEDGFGSYAEEALAEMEKMGLAGVDVWRLRDLERMVDEVGKK